MEMNTLPKDWQVTKIANIHPPDEFVVPTPWERGTWEYNAPGNVTYRDEIQVGGSYSRYNHPSMKELHLKIRDILEKMMGEKIYPSYYFDRFYFKGNELVRHIDRGACEISVSYHISSNLNYEWPIYFENETGDRVSLTCNPGDAILYRGCDLHHWREPMKGNAESCFHQAFFHFVRADGYNVQHAYDQLR